MIAPQFPASNCICGLLVVVILFAAGDAKAQNTLTESEQKRILDRLENLHKTTLEVKFGRYANALAAFQAAAETPTKAYDFYLECYKLVNFDQKGMKFSDYRDWKERNIKRIRATENQRMLQFQLRYLVMTIRALHMKDRSEIIPQLQAFIQSMVDESEKMGEAAQGLGRGVTGTVFAQAYEIELKAVEGSTYGWEMAPLNLSGHFRQLILPALRDEGNTKGLEQAWNRRIGWEIALMAPVEDLKVRDDFVSKTLPSLQWSKWQDIAEHGERAKAANAMLELIEQHLQHPNAEGWITSLSDTVREGSVTDADFEEDDATPEEPEGEASSTPPTTPGTTAP
ncbi:MAG: hypothetical protein ACI9NC_002281 [Verrucomicrobiales bacterium]|jgi:hypothetical protein